MDTLKYLLQMLKRRINTKFLNATFHVSRKVRHSLTSNVNGLQGKGLLLIVNQSGLFCLVSHRWQGLCRARVWAVWTRYTNTIIAEI